METKLTPLKGLIIVQPTIFGDERGWFYELYNHVRFHEAGLPEAFVQDNRSSSIHGVLRGLHFQRPPKAQGKLVSCTKGRIWDVAVDLRVDSSTYTQWFGIELSADEKKMLYIPSGFAHGFYALEACEMLYKCTEPYDAGSESGIAWNDPTIGIKWPLDDEPIISKKDAQLLPLDQTDNPF